MLNHHHVTRRARRKLALLGAASAAMAVAASPASAAVDGSIYANGLNSPGGTVSMGSHQWVADHVNGFCRLDKNAATGKFTINAATCNTAAASPGQPTFDAATNMVYVPDNSTKGNAVYRLKFNPTTQTVSTSAALGASAIAAGTKPTATALGPDGSLYVGSVRSGKILRIANPATTGSPVQSVGVTSDGRGANGIAFANASDGSLGASLYIAEGGGISEIADATTCTGACAATMTAIVPQTLVNGKLIAWETVDVVAAGPDTLYVAKWAPHDFGPKTTIVKYTISTGSAVDHSTSYVAPDGKLQPWTSVTDLALNPAGGLFVSHDPTNGGTNGALVSQIAG
jgi:hypothetical protein